MKKKADEELTQPVNHNKKFKIAPFGVICFTSDESLDRRGNLWRVKNVYSVLTLSNLPYMMTHRVTLGINLKTLNVAQLLQ